jgi:hypothetical protein
LAEGAEQKGWERNFFTDTKFELVIDDSIPKESSLFELVVLSP